MGTRSLRPPGWLNKPAGLRSVDVCLESKGPFIDVLTVGAGFQPAQGRLKAGPTIANTRESRAQACSARTKQA
jgi:hypothetical protein